METRIRIPRAFLAAVWISVTGFATTSLAADGSPPRDDTARNNTAAPDKERGPSAAVLERAAYVHAVLDENPSIEAARNGWRAALARVREAGSFDDPMVTAEVAPLSIGSSNAPLGYLAMISQRLPWPGKRGLDDSVAGAEAEAAKRDLEATRRELALAASLLYDDYFVAVRSLETNAQHIALMRELKAAALAQFESGRGSAQDPLQAEAELTHMEHDAVMLASERDVTMAQMNELLHRDPSLSLAPPTAALTTPNGPDPADSAHLAREALANRPEIESARLHARAEQARAARAERESYPDFTVSTSYNSMWGMPEHRWMVGLGLNLPVNLARRAGAVEEANAARARFESEAASMSDKVRTEVAVAVRRLTEAHHVVMLYDQRLVPVARDQMDAARAGFVSSRNDFLSVTAAEKNLRSVELSYQIACATVDRRHAELESALGHLPGLDDRRTAP